MTFRCFLRVLCLVLLLQLLASIFIVMVWIQLSYNGRLTPTPERVNTDSLAEAVLERVCCQEEALGQVLAAINELQSGSRGNWLILLLRGSSGTGKTLLASQLVQQWPLVSGGMLWRRFVGVEATKARPELLAAEIASDLIRNSWLVLIVEQVDAETLSRLMEYLERSVRKVGGLLLVLFSETVTDSHWSSSVESSLEGSLSAPFSDRLRVVEFSRMSRDCVLTCVRLASREMKLVVKEWQLQQLVNDQLFDEGFSVNGCKPAVSQLIALAQSSEL